MGPMGLIILWVYFWRNQSIIFEEMQAIARSEMSLIFGAICNFF